MTRTQTMLLVVPLVVGATLFAFWPRAAPLSVGTFNIRMFPEEKTDHARVAALIAELDVDAFAVQEIRDEQALLDVLARASKESGRDLRLTLSSCGRWTTGVVWDQSRLSLFATRQFRELKPDDSGRCDGRQPAHLAIFTDAAGHRVGLLAVHLKAGGGERDLAVRKKQWPRVIRILEMAEETYDAEVVALGDFNSTGWYEPTDEREFIARTLKAAGRRLATQEIACTAYWQPEGHEGHFSRSTLDHVVVNGGGWRAEPMGMCKRLACAARVDDVGRDFSRASDHCPVRAVR